MTWMKKLCDVVNFEVSWSARSRYTNMHKTMVIKKGMMNATMMRITMRGIIMKA